MGGGVATLLVWASTCLCLMGVTGAHAGAGGCDASSALHLVGKPVAGVDLDSVRRKADAASFRVFVRGRVYTMESRADRLSIFTDEQGRVVAVSCG